MSGIIQREAAAGDNIRQLVPLGQVSVKIHGVVTDHKGKINVRKLCFQPGGQFLHHGLVPKIHGQLDL